MRLMAGSGGPHRVRSSARHRDRLRRG
jgi:hypothetical protein